MNEEQMQAPMSAAPATCKKCSKVWMITAIIFIITTLVLGAMMFMGISDSSDKAMMDDDKSDEVMDDEMDEVECSEEKSCNGDFVCEEGECVAVAMDDEFIEAFGSVAAGSNQVGFKYSKTTQVVRNAVSLPGGESLRASFAYQISDSIIHICGECGGPLSPIQILSYQQSDVSDVGQFVQNHSLAFNATTMIDDVKESSEELENGTLWKFSGTYNDESDYYSYGTQTEVWVFIGENDWIIQLEYVNWSGNNDELWNIWQLMKETIDFSEVE